MHASTQARKPSVCGVCVWSKLTPDRAECMKHAFRTAVLLKNDITIQH